VEKFIMSFQPPSKQYLKDLTHITELKFK